MDVQGQEQLAAQLVGAADQLARLAFLDGSLWAGALRGERLWQVPVTADGVGRPQGWFVGDYGRLRTVTATPRGTLWVTTSNRDGRGDPAAEDDRILEIALD